MMSVFLWVAAVVAAPGPASVAPAGSPLAARPTWPEAGSLTATIAVSRPTRRRRIAIDAGHGAPRNAGAVSITCEQEQDFTMRVARAVIARLEDRFDLIETRAPGTAASYASRVEQAVQAHAEALISFHFDVRGVASVRAHAPDGRACGESTGSVGFAVLWSDEGKARLVAQRHGLARAVAAAMARRGFTAYDGVDYPGLYDGDETTPGVFVDRHVPRQRVYLLRRTSIPTIIVETHHALHAEEWARWREPATLDALAESLAEALSAAP